MNTERDPSLFPASSTSAKALDGSITADVQRSMATAMIRHNPALMPDDLLESTFAGRDPVLADLVERVRQNSGKDSVQHYLLIGPRGSGKTTLLRLLAIRVNQDSGLAEEWHPVVFAEEEF